MRVALYARVSTNEWVCTECGKEVPGTGQRRRIVNEAVEHFCKGAWRRAEKRQDTENQLAELRLYCERNSWQIAEAYIDNVSGKSGDRDAFKRLFDDASKRKFDVVLVWALDRFTREGVFETFDYIRKLTVHGVQFESYTEAHFRTTGPAGELMLAIAAWIAKQERLRISDRTKAGVARAKRDGKHCGRPSKVYRRDQAAEMRSRGMSWRAIASELKVPVRTLRRGVAQVSS
jgi:DNA invertase Pin-like site-specific DNA recombinase